MKLNTVLVSALSAITLVAVAPSAASAQIEDDADDRAGLTIGIGAGMGHLECSGDMCDGVTEAGGLDAHIGVVLAPQFAIMGELWGMAHAEDRLTVAQTMATVGPQVWVVPRLWLRAGIGVARASYNYDAEVVEFMDSTDWVPAAMAAAGVELISGRDFVMDLQLRAGAGFFNEGDTEIQNLSIGLGANWY
jgi:hypothetical protein